MQLHSYTECNHLLNMKVLETMKELETDEKYSKQSAKGWLIAAYIFAILGGLFGFIFGMNVCLNKKYKTSHRWLGFLAAILSSITITLGKKLAQ